MPCLWAAAEASSPSVRQAATSVDADFFVFPGVAIASQVLVANGRLEDARKVLDTAMAAPGIRAPLSAEQRERLSKKGLEPSTHERAGVYLLLAEVHQKLWAQKQQRQQQDAAAAASPGLQLSGAPQSGRQQATAAAGRGGSATAESPEARKVGRRAQRWSRPHGHHAWGCGTCACQNCALMLAPLCKCSSPPPTCSACPYPPTKRHSCWRRL